jgi:uncharacterized protein YggU (UPF0235/DUF167 family)
VSDVDAHRRGDEVRFSLANEALIELLSRAPNTSRRNVCIVSGYTSRTKLIEISEASLDQFNICWLRETP